MPRAVLSLLAAALLMSVCMLTAPTARAFSIAAARPVPAAAARGGWTRRMGTVAMVCMYTRLSECCCGC